MNTQPATQSTIGNYRPAFVLVDDDEDDRLLMRMALKETHADFPIVELEDGQALIEYLEKTDTHQLSRDVLCLVIMDVNMPRLNGPDTLEQMQQHVVWKDIPVMMMSTSDDPDMIRRLLAMGAVSYVVKPKSYTGLINRIQTVFAPWIRNCAEEKEEKSVSAGR